MENGWKLSAYKQGEEGGDGLGELLGTPCLAGTHAAVGWVSSAPRLGPAQDYLLVASTTL